MNKKAIDNLLKRRYQRLKKELVTLQETGMNFNRQLVLGDQIKNLKYVAKIKKFHLWELKAY